MTLMIESTPVPLETDNEGVVRVVGSRVTLDTLVEAFLDGETPESIADQYPGLPLSHIYSAIAFYLDHTEQVDDYLRERQRQRAAVREDNESRFPPEGIRHRLLARRQRS